MSLPLGERGLKYLFELCRCDRIKSLPLGERGLKFTRMPTYTAPATVAPFRGAWIEIHRPFQIRHTTWVAPFRGAWIEIVSKSHFGPMSRFSTS